MRTWHRRDTGWFAHALTPRRARIRVPGLEADVTFEDVAGAMGGLAATLQLDREQVGTT